MRIALVSPYSWTYPGGVTRHIEALAEQHLAAGHDVRVLSPVDPDDRVAARMHRGARPSDRELPDWLIPLGRTVGFPSNGAVSNVPYTPTRRERAAPRAARRRLRRHPPARAGRAVLVLGHAVRGRRAARRDVSLLLGERHLQQRRERHGRAPPAQPAARADRRVRGRGLDGPALLRRQLPDHPERGRRARRSLPVARAAGAPARRCGSRSSARRSSARACRCCCARSRRCASTCRSQLHVVGVTAEEIAPLMIDTRDVFALGKCSDEDKRRVLERADMLCAPSLGGESFGMVLTEAFAAGTPVVASDIAGYRDVVTRRRRRRARPARRRDGARRGRCATSRSIPARRARARARRGSLGAALRLAAGRRARSPRPTRTRSRCRAPAGSRVSVRLGFTPADGERVPAVRLPTLEPLPAAAGGAPRPAARLLRRRGDRARGAARDAARGLRAAAHRRRADRRVAARRDADLGPRRARAHVLLDGAARRRVARDPARGAAALDGAARRRAAGDVHRRAHVRDPARPPRRAGARVRRRAADRQRAAAPARRARDDRLADAAQRARARSCSG